MKRIYVLLLKSFLSPFFASFTVALFILVLQFLAKYQNDIFGKGLGVKTISEIFFYASIQLTLLALPVAILISSLSTIGKLGENYELAALKSSGISLFQTIQPLLGVCTLLCFISCFYAWYLVPKTNLKLYTVMYDAKKSKPEFFLTPGFFDRSFNAYTIYFSNFSPSGALMNLKIWDHSQSPRMTNLTIADSAYMKIDQEKFYLRFTLFNGERHQTSPKTNPSTNEKSTYSKMSFDTLFYKLDMAEFAQQNIEEEQFRSHRYMLTLWELYEFVDSLRKEPLKITSNIDQYLSKHFKLSENNKEPPLPVSIDLKREITPKVLSDTKNSARSIKNFLGYQLNTHQMQDRTRRKYEIEFHLKFTLPLSCFLMLFLGAPLGAIIRKGGLGMPTLVSLLLFVLFYVLMTQGRKLCREEVVEAWLGTWLPIIVMSPVAIYLTYQSATDSKIFDLRSWKQFFNLTRFIKKFTTRSDGNSHKEIE